MGHPVITSRSYRVKEHGPLSLPRFFRLLLLALLQLSQRVRHRRGEEQRLPLLRQPLEYVGDPLVEAAVEQAVGLVHDEVADLREGKRVAGVEVVS